MASRTLFPLNVPQKTPEYLLASAGAPEESFPQRRSQSQVLGVSVWLHLGKLSLFILNGIVLLMLLKLLIGIKAEGLEFRSL